MSIVFDVSEDEFVESVSPSKIVKLTAPLDISGFSDAVKPLDVYSALRGNYSFLLESAEKEVSAFKQVSNGSGSERGARYSFVGFEPDAMVRVDDRTVDVRDLNGRDGLLDTNDSKVIDDSGHVKDGYDTLDALRSLFPDVEPVNFDDSDRQVFEGGFVGYLAYDVVYDIWIDREKETEDTVPDAEFVVSTKNAVFDHDKDEVSLVFTPLVCEGDDRIEEYEPREASRFEVLDRRSGTKEVYEEGVDQTRQHILDGDIYQAVLSRKREIDVKGDIRDFYSALRELNPSPYMYLTEIDGFGVVGSSPETLVNVHDGRVSTNPIAGTCPRGETAVEDRRLAGEMLSDEKELCEHVMLVDLGRNDVRRVSESGTVRVDDFMSVVQYSHVQHMESVVSGDLREDKDAFDATRSVFPAGTLSGAPKIRAMEIIDDLEPEHRGVYGGGVGYYSWSGDMDFAIAIRTATFEERADHQLITVQAGAGIVADSDPEREFHETEDKMDALLAALDSLVEKERETEVLVE
ncbi:MAG: anthranilate synthase component I [Halobacteria archaeon]|nr:anthranilate synthase component I [Halobacteria archaeon]